MPLHPIIEENQDIRNIELGAGCGNFGEVFFSPCFLTDSEPISILQDICETCHITITCKAEDIPAPDNRFDKTIMCNPFSYGFRDREDAEELLNELYRVGVDQSEIHIITHEKNPYSNKVQKRVKAYNEKHDEQRFVFSFTPIDVSQAYPDYKFYQVDGKTPTVPNVEIILICNK